MDFSGEVEAEDALATPAAQAETRRVAPRLVAAVTVLPGDDALVLAVATGSTPFFLTCFVLAGAANTHGLGTASRRMATLFGLGTVG